MPISNAPEFVQKLKAELRSFVQSERIHGQKATFVPQALLTTSHVFVRKPPIHPALEPPYQGPYPVLSRTDKTYTIDIDGEPDCVNR